MSNQKLEEMTVKELAAHYKKLSGIATKESNKKKLLDLIEQHERMSRRATIGRAPASNVGDSRRPPRDLGLAVSASRESEPSALVIARAENVADVSAAAEAAVPVAATERQAEYVADEAVTQPNAANESGRVEGPAVRASAEARRISVLPQGRWETLSDGNLRQMYQDKIGPTNSGDRRYLINRLRQVEQGWVPPKRGPVITGPKTPVTISFADDVLAVLDEAAKGDGFTRRLPYMRTLMAEALAARGHHSLADRLARRNGATASQFASGRSAAEGE